MRLILALALQLNPGVPADSVETIRESARRAEANFERLARRLAPVRGWSGSGGDCDEIVGRFCLTYDEGRLPEPAPEPPRVTDARRDAIEALRLAFSHEPGRLETTGPLVRYLVEDERAAEAVSAARTYAVLTGDSVWGPLLLGFALHAAAEDSAAERLFDEGMAHLDPFERREMLDVEWLLSSSDRGIWRDRSEAGRDSLSEVLWRHADPLYLTPGNERRAEHVARRVWSRILEMTPRVRDMPRWADDLEQLTVRYGVPTARTRTWGTVYTEGTIVEHYDPEQLSYVQADLFDKGPAPLPPPGEDWPLGEPRSRSGYAPRTVRRIVHLDHQVTRFPAVDGRGSVLRVDGHFAMDSVAAGAHGVATGLFVRRLPDLDAAGRVDGAANVVADTARFGLELAVEPGALVYSLEAIEQESRLGARARYTIDIDTLAEPFALSDPLIADAWPAARPPTGRGDAALRPRGRLIFAAGESVGLYAEARGLRLDAAGESRYRVELSIRKTDRGSFPARALNWIGRQLGLASERVPARVAWSGSSAGVGPSILAVNLPLEDLPDGLHTLTLSVTDALTGETRETTRILRIGAP